MERLQILDTDWGMRIQNNRNLLAYFHWVDTETGLEYRDWRLVRRASGDGNFVSPPAQKYQKEGQDKPDFSDYIRVADSRRNKKGKKLMRELARVATAEYERRSGGGSSPASKRTARGPVSTLSSTPNPFASDDEDSELPF